MPNPLDDLRQANNDYHEAADVIFCFEFKGLNADEAGKLKAKFGALHNNIYQLMTEAQELIKPYFTEIYEEDD